MTRKRRSRGFALLAALLVMTLGALFAAVGVAAVLSRQVVAEADAADGSARRAARLGLEGACEELRWAPLSSAGTWRVTSPATADPWDATASWTSLTPGPIVGPWPLADVRGEGRRGRARAGLRATVQLRQAGCAAGLTVAGDVELQAPLRIGGCGVYLGGSLRGRDLLGFTAPPGTDPGSPATDGVHGERWPLAGVHALGGIWAGGVEVHETGGTADPADTDTHTAAGDVSDVVRTPCPALLAVLARRAADAAPFVVDGVVDIALLPQAAASGDTAVVAVARPDPVEGLRIVGSRPASASPLVLVVVGDAVLGAPEHPSALVGALVVTGALEVAGDAALAGHLYAARLTVAAPLSLAVPGDWRERPLSGLAEPVIVALDSG